ncbi:nucleotide sugar dehydrogenase [Natronolimnohabitans innermongolicus]|uniref:UDP-N-acetyl-D-mannosamine dehydrogenase n=1 Tax=Natronolimnohabitans innermongolicus JCM 12255 TaxID=1227499 RepID=L9WK61_9EURY|nr:nucleotide sugar dehydrogenase [Natronolimnohabitans innermongolicus]ELY48753.1 nucleotide sugar dehydrogenase [Natronolimnohabitans innermongolicus JCM 12255]
MSDDTATESAAGLYGSSESPDRQRDLLTSGEIPVAVYGLGKMGLPLAGVYAETTGNVTGVDVDPDVVETINAGESHVIGEPGLDELVAEQVDAGRFEATTDGAEAAANATIHVIIVPTLLDDDDNPNLATVESVADDIAAGLEPGDLVIAESTLPPTSCRDVIKPHLEQESGLPGDEFGLAFCPERTLSGRALQDIRGAYPKVVGGVDDESTRAASVVYDEISDNDVHPVSDATTAESVKVFEGVYRDVNIGLANELGRLADELGISAREAIDTANDLPMCQLHDPGPGVGGHCIPYYPHFLLSQNEEPMDLTRTARRINDEMPTVVVDRLESELAATDTDLADASVVVLGVTYRPGVEETRASPALDVIDELNARGADVAGVDPLVDPEEYGARRVAVDDFESEPFDAAMIVTPHEEFDAIDWTECAPMVVLDGRDAVDLSATHHREYTLAGASSGRSPTGSSDETDAVTVDDRSLTADGGTVDRPSSADRTDDPSGGDDV